MRLINADALHIDYIYPTTTTGTSCWGYVSMKQINSAPTIEAVQERKGRWKSDEEEGDIMCSCCGDWWASGFETAFHYCPNCGAHMEGAKE